MTKAENILAFVEYLRGKTEDTGEGIETIADIIKDHGAMNVGLAVFNDMTAMAVELDALNYVHRALVAGEYGPRADVAPELVISSAEMVADGLTLDLIQQASEPTTSRVSPPAYFNHLASLRHKLVKAIEADKALLKAEGVA